MTGLRDAEAIGSNRHAVRGTTIKSIRDITEAKHEFTTGAVRWKTSAGEDNGSGSDRRSYSRWRTQPDWAKQVPEVPWVSANRGRASRQMPAQGHKCRRVDLGFGQPHRAAPGTRGGAEV